MAIGPTGRGTSPLRPPFWFRLRVAFRGLWIAYRQEPNLRFQVFAAAAAAVVGWAVRLSGWEVAYLAVTIGLVLMAETVNSAIERAVDLASGGQPSALAGAAKDVAAGAVLLTAFHALFAGIWLFAVQRPLMTTFAMLFQLLIANPWAALPPLAAALTGLALGQEK